MHSESRIDIDIAAVIVAGAAGVPVGIAILIVADGVDIAMAISISIFITSNAKAEDLGLIDCPTLSLRIEFRLDVEVVDQLLNALFEQKGS